MSPKKKVPLASDIRLWLPLCLYCILQAQSQIQKVNNEVASLQESLACFEREENSLQGGLTECMQTLAHKKHEFDQLNLHVQALQRSHTDEANHMQVSSYCYHC